MNGHLLATALLVAGSSAGSSPAAWFHEALVTEASLSRVVVGSAAAANTTSGGTQYLSYESFEPNTSGCNQKDLIAKGATQVGLCLALNSTMSTDYTCNAGACQANQYRNSACTGEPTMSVNIKTDGTCQQVKDPSGRYPGTVSMIATQVSDGTQGLTRPIMALYGDSGCTAAWGYVQQGRCHYIDSVGVSIKAVCVDGKSQQCTWHNSTTCPANIGKCNPTGLDHCHSIPGSMETKAMRVFCGEQTKKRVLPFPWKAPILHT